MSSTQVNARAHSVTTRRRVRSAIVVATCAPLVVACSATGFGSPVRHAVANLQAATAKLGANLEVEGAIIALPSGISSAKGGLAYLQFEAINFASQPDNLIDVSADPEPAASLPAGASSSAASLPVAQLLQAATDTSVPAATASGPGTRRISVLLRTLTAPLRQGDTVVIGMTFANSGSVRDLLVPVQGAAVVGTFLPSAPPPPPSSPVASPVASAVASPVGSPAAGSSAPVASAPASSSAAVSAPASPSAAASS